ncbi:MAG: methanogenesis marker 9 domain-containing protein [Methanobrevibacter sp.]|jgi:putative methanogenesis marker domain 9|nr:methanogenesis marker 9 domain-containing protein [Candidatus Methanoflexus mossambicus]
MSWDDAPSHVCRGGDSRALAFCCPPVKPCPILYALEDVKVSPQEYIDIKTEFGKKTRLGEGTGTCFGSMVWCCKTSKPCPLRDMVMMNIGMDEEEYLTLKKELSELLVSNGKDYTKEQINALVETFNVSPEDAEKVLEDSNNDIKIAAKLLKMQKLEKDEY